MKNCYSELLMHKRSKFEKKDKARAVVKYTGSPDSEEIATMLSAFKYQPERKQEILAKYH